MNSKPEPFLKWAGGKRSLVDRIVPMVIGETKVYHEPFVGAGAIFFNIPFSVPMRLNDTNTELVNTYESIRDECELVIDHLSTFRNTQDDYLRIRKMDREEGFDSLSTAKRAARVIYLNKCGFNGLYRVNSKGYFNVPYGHNPKADFIQSARLKSVSDYLNRKDESGNLLITFTNLDFRKALKKVKKGDFVYLDPPYDPISKTASFTAYSANGFGDQDQEDLRDEMLRLTEKGVRVLMSNSNTKLIRSLFSERKIFHVSKIDVRRSIAASGIKRTPASEVLIDNFKWFR